MVESKPVKQEVIRTVILLPLTKLVSVLCLGDIPQALCSTTQESYFLVSMTLESWITIVKRLATEVSSYNNPTTTRTKNSASLNDQILIDKKPTLLKVNLSLSLIALNLLIFALSQLYVLIFAKYYHNGCVTYILPWHYLNN